MSIKNKVIVFDLDDTLYKEIDFLKSAYLEIASIVDKDHCETLYDNMIQTTTKEKMFLSLFLNVSYLYN